MALIITGTGTGVGKTVVAAWLALHLQTRYWKPVQTGRIEGTDTDFVRSIIGENVLPETYCFSAPRSPHYAAELEGCVPVVAALPAAPRDCIIEGAGGPLVPFNADLLMIDVFATFAAPLLIVSDGRLGAINHTLLTIEAIRKRDLPILGVVFSRDALPETAAAIEHFGGVSVLGTLGEMAPVDRNALLGRRPPEPLLSATKAALS